MRNYQLYRYRIPFESQLILRGRKLPYREGLLVRVQCKDNVGWGEIAPLPSFSVETLEMAEKQTALWLQQWDIARAKEEKLSLEELYPSVAFGLSCALAEMKNQLGIEGNYQTVPLCYGDLSEIMEKCHTVGSNPFASQSAIYTAKMKIGLSSAVDEGKMAERYLSAMPHLRLRLDANRKWDLTQALEFARQISEPCRQQITFIEEPCQSPEQSRAFACQTNIAIAWDESTREPHFQLAAEPFLRAVVIKPTLVGSLEKCVALIQQAHQVGLQAVISSSIESSLGLTQLARIAKQYTAETIPGLDTLNLVSHQLLRRWQGSNLPLLDLSQLGSPYLQRIL